MFLFLLNWLQCLYNISGHTDGIMKSICNCFTFGSIHRSRFRIRVVVTYMISEEVVRNLLELTTKCKQLVLQVYIQL